MSSQFIQTRSMANVNSYTACKNLFIHVGRGKQSAEATAFPSNANEVRKRKVRHTISAKMHPRLQISTAIE